MQTAFYGACAVGIYLLFELIASLVSKDKTGPSTTGVLRAAAIVVVAAGFTYGMGVDRTQAVAEYLPYSTRGAPAVGATSSSAAESDGHGYGYATQWSFSPEEMATFLIPGYFGWGYLEYSGPETGNQSQRVPTYWGQMPFTDAAHYMGIAVLILGLFGAWVNRRNRFVQAMSVVGVFGLVLSFGSTMPLLYDIFYNLVEPFRSLRAPSQSLVLLEFAFPILAGYGIESLLAMRRAGDNPAANKSLFYALIGAVVFAVLGLIGPAMLKSGYLSSVASSPAGQRLTPTIHEFVFSTMAADWLVAGLLAVATTALMYYYVKGRVSPTLLKIGLLCILIFDLWRVDYRSMETTPKSELEQKFAPTDIDRFLATDTSKYRVLDLYKASAVGPNAPAYQFHENIMGYHAAKMRNYQDLLDFTDGSAPGDSNGNVPTAQTAWNILNTKYIIYEQPLAEGLRPVFTSQETKQTVWLNERALPRAWFVNRVEVATPRQTLERIRDGAFDPRDVAYVTAMPSAKIEPVGYAPSSTPPPADTTVIGDTSAPRTSPVPAINGGGTVDVTRHEPHHITLEVTAPGNNFLVVSEMHYPPGWRATIDGQPAEIVQTNHVLRGLVVPAGRHTIEMHMVSDSVATGKWISLALNVVALGMIVAGAMIERRRPKDADARHDAPVIAEDDV